MNHAFCVFHFPHYEPCSSKDSGTDLCAVAYSLLSISTGLPVSAPSKRMDLNKLNLATPVVVKKNVCAAHCHELVKSSSTESCMKYMTSAMHNSPATAAPYTDSRVLFSC